MNAPVDVEARIREILANVVEIEVESEDDDIFETGRLDSLGLVELIFAIEEQLGVAIALDQLDVEEFTNVRSIVALVAAAEEQPAVAPRVPSADEADVRQTGETELRFYHRARPLPDAGLHTHHSPSRFVKRASPHSTAFTMLSSRAWTSIRPPCVNRMNPGSEGVVRRVDAPAARTPPSRLGATHGA